MMMKFVALALALASASAFAPAPQRVPSGMALHMGAESMEGASAPFGYWDPMGISEYGSDATLAWFRHAELKHGRVAMVRSSWTWERGGGVTKTGLHFCSWNPEMRCRSCTISAMCTIDASQHRSLVPDLYRVI